MIIFVGAAVGVLLTALGKEDDLMVGTLVSTGDTVGLNGAIGLIDGPFDGSGNGRSDGLIVGTNSS